MDADERAALERGRARAAAGAAGGRRCGSALRSSYATGAAPRPAPAAGSALRVALGALATLGGLATRGGLALLGALALLGGHRRDLLLDARREDAGDDLGRLGLDRHALGRREVGDA